MKIHSQSAGRFKSLLKDTFFHFDTAELDFGIYRIMNYRREEIEDFIEKDLMQAVEKEFEIYKAQSAQQLLSKIGEKKKEIEELEKKLAKKILRNGQIEDEFKGTPFAKEYLELKRQLDEVEVTESEQAQVFNDLYNFFSRYYEDGDFVSKRRYSSRGTRYAIPYNGEEVKLYWANFDQYYVKTGEVFKDYEFDCNGWRIVFRTTFADVETGNVKGERRYFLVAPSDAVNVDEESKACLIQFEYRPLTDEDLSKYKVTTKTGEEKKTAIQQDEISTILNGMILGKIKEAGLKAVLSEKTGEKTILERHLYKYTHKITSDFFIHKNLKGFLGRELDYFIKTEVLDIGNLDPRHVTRAKVVENIGKRIIEFLSQIEEYQKLLWEKKKFVLRTDYVITTDRMPEEFQEEVLRCPAQLEEWQDLGFGQISKREDLNGKKLPVDSKHFDESFKERLLEKLSEHGNLDDLIDGILIKSENWQALNLISTKCKNEVKCIYIDPPYNTGSDEFIYKDNYQHSCWLTMMSDRLELARRLASDDAVLFVSMDDNELSEFSVIAKKEFGIDSLFGPVIVQVNKGGRSYLPIAKMHEYVVCAFMDKRAEIYEIPKETEVSFEDSRGAWIPRELRNRNPRFTRENRPNLFYPFYVDPTGTDKHGYCTVSLAESSKHTIEVYPKNREGRDSCWRWSKEKVALNISSEGTGKSEIIAKQKADGGWNIYEKYRKQTTKAKSIWDESSVRTENGTIQLRNLFGSLVYHYPKPVELAEKCINLGADATDCVMDFFAGSGTTAHAVINLNRKDKGYRKYILVEIGNWFDTVLLPRIKKALFCEKWMHGKPAGGDGLSHFVKYQILEQYEDTLQNIEFPHEGKGQQVLKLFPEEASEYVMKYMLKYETEGSPSLLNLKQFENPFEYKLRIISEGKGGKIVAVDLVETFNYLLGLRVGKYKLLSDNGRKYVIVLGERGNRRVAVVWRPTKDIGLEKDREVIDKAITDFHPDEIFINGDAFVKDYKVSESEFKALMGVQSWS